MSGGRVSLQTGAPLQDRHRIYKCHEAFTMLSTAPAQQLCVCECG